jgi:hypothetical protein
MVKAFAVLTLWLCVALPAVAAAPPKKQPDWSQLTSEQQQILAPLSSDWKEFDDRRRKKWLLTAKRYPKMEPDAQQRLQAQMRDWVKLTPEQRRIARENYKKLAKQPPEKREAVKQKWQERQQKAVPSKSAAPSTADQSADKAASPPSPANPPR